MLTEVVVILTLMLVDVESESAIEWNVETPYVIPTHRVLRTLPVIHTYTCISYCVWIFVWKVIYVHIMRANGFITYKHAAGIHRGCINQWGMIYMLHPSNLYAYLPYASLL